MRRVRHVQINFQFLHVFFEFIAQRHAEKQAWIQSWLLLRLWSTAALLWLVGCFLILIGCQKTLVDLFQGQGHVKVFAIDEANLVYEGQHLGNHQIGDLEKKQRCSFGRSSVCNLVQILKILDSYRLLAKIINSVWRILRRHLRIHCKIFFARILLRKQSKMEILS